jgi:hypothetical protein
MFYELINESISSLFHPLPVKPRAFWLSMVNAVAFLRLLLVKFGIRPLMYLVIQLMKLANRRIFMLVFTMLNVA